MTDGENAIELLPVTVGGEALLKAVISRNSDEAAVNATYVITVSEAGYTATKTATINIASYAEAILKGEYTDGDKQLMYYMVEYANEAAKYFGKDNTALATLLETYSEAKGDETVDKSYSAALESTGLGAVFSEASVRLTSAPAFVFTLKDSIDGTVTVRYAGNERIFSTAGKTEIAVDGMKVYNFTSAVYVTVEYKVGEETVTVEGVYNLDTYAKYHTEVAASEPSEDLTEETIAASEKALALIEALYAYATVADAYTK